MKKSEEGVSRYYEEFSKIVKGITARILVSLTTLIIYEMVFYFLANSIIVGSFPFIFVLVLVVPFIILTQTDFNHFLLRIFDAYDYILDKIEKNFWAKRVSGGRDELLFYQVFVGFRKSVILDFAILLSILLYWYFAPGQIKLFVEPTNFVYLKLFFWSVFVVLLAHMIHRLSLPNIEGENSLKYFGYYERLNNYRFYLTPISLFLSCLLATLIVFPNIILPSTQSLDSITFGSYINLELVTLLIAASLYVIFHGSILASAASKKPLFTLQTIIIVLSGASLSSTLYLFDFFGVTVVNLPLFLVILVLLVPLITYLDLLDKLIGSIGVIFATPFGDKKTQLIKNRYKFISESSKGFKVSFASSLFFSMLISTLVVAERVLLVNQILILSFIGPKVIILGSLLGYFSLRELVNYLNNELKNEEKRLMELAEKLNKRERRRAKSRKKSRKVVTRDDGERAEEYTKILEEFESIFAGSESNEF